jgi:periplasmic divalent cation tolerance protein
MTLLVVLSTFPDLGAARAAAEVLVNERLAACVNILPGVESVYRWHGEVQSGTEVLAIIKTTNALWQSLEQRLRKIHPYEVPEIVALNAAAVADSYLRWVSESVVPDEAG